MACKVLQLLLKEEEIVSIDVYTLSRECLCCCSQTDQIVFGDAGFMVQGVHAATEQVNLSQQLHMLKDRNTLFQVNFTWKSEI